METGDLGDEPLGQLASWLDEARLAGERMPEAMCLATAGADGLPAARMVLMRGLDTGVVFFTDYESDKAADLRVNPRASAVFHYFVPVHRQVRVTGSVEPTSAEESDRYWVSRPLGSRHSAIASHQSSIIGSRRELEQAVAATADDAEPVRPERRGGFRLTPEAVEFWEEGQNRLHDRLRYVRVPGNWRVERLAP